MAAELNGIRVAVFAVDGFEEDELLKPVEALKNSGAEVDIVSLEEGKIQGFKHQEKSKKVKVDRVLEDVDASEYDALLLPGGALNADTTRIEPMVQEFICDFEQQEKPIAAICHAPWLLVSSGLVNGRKLTSYKTIQDDIKNAGGDWSDEEVIVDLNWVTSRQPSDIPAFNREFIRSIENYAEKKKSESAA